MKIFVKTLKGSHFNIEVNPQDTVADVKKNIETVQGANVYPASQQMLIHQGKVLKDDTTLEENKVAENSFIVIMLMKSKGSSAEGSKPATAAVATPTSQGKSSGEGSTAASAATTAMPTSQGKSSGEGSTAASAATTAMPTSQVPPAMASPTSVSEFATPPAPVANAPPPTSVPVSSPAPVISSAMSESDVDGQAASNLLAGSNLEPTIQEILDMGGGTWDRDTVVRALRAAYNNPERAVDYLYSGIPEQADVPLASQSTGGGQTTNATSVPQQPTQAASVPSSGPNANPLNLFPQGLPNVGSDAAPAGALDFLRNSKQFQALRAMVQANPQVLQPMLQELGKQNPNLVRLIQEHQPDFLRLINEPLEGDEGDILGHLADAMPQSIEVTPEEHEAIERLEAMGFDRATVLEVYFACNKNEELAANYLLDHMNDLED